MKPLTAEAIRTMGADVVRTVLIDTGAHIWQDDAIKCRMRAVSRAYWRDYPLRAFVAMLPCWGVPIVPFALACAAFLGVMSVFNASLNDASSDITTVIAAAVAMCAYVAVGVGLVIFKSSCSTWQINCVYGTTYYRDGQLVALPRPIVELAQRITAIFPKSNFSVGFFGCDPILYWMDTRTGKRVTVCVWDELPDGQIQIVPPPT